MAGNRGDPAWLGCGPQLLPPLCGHPLGGRAQRGAHACRLGGVSGHCPDPSSRVGDRPGGRCSGPGLPALGASPWAPLCAPRRPLSSWLGALLLSHLGAREACAPVHTSAAPYGPNSASTPASSRHGPAEACSCATPSRRAGVLGHLAVTRGVCRATMSGAWRARALRPALGVWLGLDGAPGVVPAGGTAAGSAAGTSPSGRPQGPAASAFPPCWTATRRVTYPTRRPRRAPAGAPRLRAGRPQPGSPAPRPQVTKCPLMAVGTSVTWPPSSPM